MNRTHPETLEIYRSIDGLEIEFINRGAPSHSGGRAEFLAGRILTFGLLGTTLLMGVLLMAGLDALWLTIAMFCAYPTIGIMYAAAQRTQANRFESLRLTDRALQINQTGRSWLAPLEDVLEIEIREDPTPVQGNAACRYLVVRSAGGEELIIEAILNKREASWLKAAIEDVAAYRREALALDRSAQPGRPPPELLSLLQR